MTAVRSIFDDLWVSSLEHRLEAVPCGPQALAKVASYSEMLFVHRSTGTRTDLEAIQSAIETVRELSGSDAAGDRRLPAEGQVGPVRRRG